MSGTINAADRTYANGTIDNEALQIGATDPNAVQPLALRNEVLGTNTAIEVGLRATYPNSLPAEYGQIDATGVNHFAGHIFLGGLSAGVLGEGGGFATFPQTLTLNITGRFVNTGTVSVQDYGTLNVIGHGTLENDGNLQIFNAAFLDTRITGTGTIDVLGTSFSPPGVVEIAGPVGSGETIKVESSHLQIDNAMKFLGTIDDNNYGHFNAIALEGVHATSASFTELAAGAGVFELMNGHRPVAMLHFADVPAGVQIGVVNQPNGSAAVLGITAGQTAPAGFIPAHVFSAG